MTSAQTQRYHSLMFWLCLGLTWVNLVILSISAYLPALHARWPFISLNILICFVATCIHGHVSKVRATSN